MEWRSGTRTKYLDVFGNVELREKQIERSGTREVPLKRMYGQRSQKQRATTMDVGDKEGNDGQGRGDEARGEYQQRSC